MNKKKGFVIGGAALGVVIIIALVIILVIAIGDDGKENGSLPESSLLSTELTTEIEDTTEVDSEESTEENTTEEETTDEEATDKIIELPDGTPEEIVAMDVIELGYDTYMDAYLYLLDIYEKVYGDEFTCSLIDYDVSLELELLIDIDKELTLYKYETDYGRLYKIIDKLDYGQFSSGGYEYTHISHAVTRVDREYDGLIMYETVLLYNLDVTEENMDTCNLRTHVYNLRQTFFDDVNENGIPDEGEATGEEYIRYYVNDERVYGLEYYNAARPQGDKYPFKGELSLYEVKKELHKPEFEWVKDKKCKDGYKEIIKEFESKYPDAECTYALIDCDNDETPELVCDRGGSISLYTYDYGRIFQLIDNSTYEEIGNIGYEYIPGKNIFRYISSNQESGEFAVNYAKKNDDGQLEECAKKDVVGNYYMIRGYYSREEIEECLTDKEPGRR